MNPEGFAALARRQPAALAARLEAAVAAGLGTPVRVAVAAAPDDTAASAGPEPCRSDAEHQLGRVALARALVAAGRAAGGPIAWPCDHASVSHSGGVAVAVAVPTTAGARGLGVDVEVDRRLRPGLARLFCEPRELAWLDGLAAADRDPALLRLWTAKEALYKADPAQGDAIVADYVVELPALTRGGRPGAMARLFSIRLGDATVSVALRSQDQEDDHVEATR